MLQELINTFEELKKYVFIIDRGNKGKIILKFKDEYFYHLVGLHKINFNVFLPNYIKTKEKQYKYIKNNIKKYDNILQNQILEKNTLTNRINTFHKILDLLLNSENTFLYNLKERVPESMYNGDFGLLKTYETLYCLLGLKITDISDNLIHCVPQSWMVSNRETIMTKYKVPIYLKEIQVILKDEYKEIQTK